MSAPVVCLECLDLACPGWRRRSRRWLPPYRCDDHDPRLRRGVPWRVGRGGTAITGERLVCPVCLVNVDWHDAVATQADHVVHARCHRLVQRFSADRPAS